MPALPMSSSTAATGSGWPGTWPTYTPGRWTLPVTSSPATSFRVVFERRVSQDGEVRVGHVLAERPHDVGQAADSAFRFGGVLAAAISTTMPMGAHFAGRFCGRQWSSGGSPPILPAARFHPVLGLSRRHEGTDYAAAPGTPVMAAGDGVVLRAGRAGGYGNLIELRHVNGITTRYGHLRGFARGIRGGARVVQGQVIGYVGSTGLATGPHLHYEFRENGIARDSRRVTLGTGSPVSSQDRAAFERERDRLLLLLDQPADSTSQPSAIARQVSQTSERWLP